MKENNRSVPHQQSNVLVEGRTMAPATVKQGKTYVPVALSSPPTLAERSVTLVAPGSHTLPLATSLRAHCQTLKIQQGSGLCQASVLEPFHDDSLLSQFFRGAMEVKMRLVKWILRVLPEPSAGIVLAIALGDTSGLVRKQVDAFISAGVIHVLVVSGSQLVIVLSASHRILELMSIPQRYRSLLLFPILFFYVVLIGLPLPALRALAVGSIPIIARSIGRRTSSLYALVVVCGSVSIAFPFLLHQLGWLYSIAATAGIILFSSALERRLHAVGPLLRPWNPFLAPSIGASLIIMPLLLVGGSSSTWIGLVATPLVLSILAVYLPTTIVVALVATVWEGAGLILAAAINVIGLALLWFVETLAWIGRMAAIPVAFQWLLWGIFFTYTLRLLLRDERQRGL